MTAPKDTYTVYWEDGTVRMIDQRALPDRFDVLTLRDHHEVADAIRTMAVRGAPAIGVSAALGLALAARNLGTLPAEEFHSRLREAAAELRGTRPTAVNLFWAIERVLQVAERHPEPREAAEAALQEALRMVDEDVRANRALAAHGAALLPDTGGVLTHCNTGSLATVYYGTALGVIRAAVEAGKRLHVWADETRPRWQGLKLTAWECRELGIPATVISDGAAATVVRAGRIDAVIVGADRIAANGDTANKIGTYTAAVAARAHRVPFYVAAPLSTVDFTLPSGEGIPIEERDAEEVTHANGVRVAPEGIAVYNPAFDVTPAGLIAGIITERGVAYPPYETSLAALRAQGE
jgi:methylthioribose-1-phosphate isomerase